MPDPSLSPSTKNLRPVFLIVDDSLPMRKALNDMMELSYPASLILQAESAEQALQMVTVQSPDLVLMDIALPGMDGLTCLAEILHTCPHVRSVVISYHEEQPYHQKALQAGADAYVVKRRLYVDLLPAIKNLIKEEITAGLKGSL